jgi:hypothetical protein
MWRMQEHQLLLERLSGIYVFVTEIVVWNAYKEQKSDWEQHKSLCKALAKSTSLRPECHRALFFPPDQSRPRFIWLHYGTDGVPIDIAMCFPNTPKSDIKTIAFHNRYFSYWIQLSYDGNVDGNRTLNNNSAVQNAFRGPVVALAYDAEEGLGKPALDVDTGTLNPVLEYAKLRAEYVGPVFVEQPQEKYEEQAWMAFMKIGRGG